jgi:hypothetical protein
MTPLDREFLGVAFNFHKGKHDFVRDLVTAVLTMRI